MNKNKKLTQPRNYTSANGVWRIGLLPLVSLLWSLTLVHAAVPPDPLVELRFPEGPNDSGGAGLTTTNTGYSGVGSGGLATFADVLASGYPEFTNNVPAGPYTPAGNVYSAYFGPTGGGAAGRAVDLVTDATAFNPPGDGSLGALPSGFTVCGWINLAGANGRIMDALDVNANGFELAVHNQGMLTIGINVPANAGLVPGQGPFTPTSAYIPPTDPSFGTNNWTFFAVTYDPTNLNLNLSFYFGGPKKLAQLDSSWTYFGGYAPDGSIPYTGTFTVGNFNPGGYINPYGPAARAAIFNGLLDEIKVYTNVLTLDQIQQAQLNGPVSPVAASIITPPANESTLAGQTASFSVVGNGSGQLTYQWYSSVNGGVSWTQLSGATNSSYTTPTLVLTNNGTQFEVGVSNSVGGVLSPAAKLTVLASSPLLVLASFTESGQANRTNTGSVYGPITTNAGFLGGDGLLFQRTATVPDIYNPGLQAYPRFSTYVPVGPYAPDPRFNQYSIDFGQQWNWDSANYLSWNQGGRVVDFTNNTVNPANTLPNMDQITLCGWLNAAGGNFRFYAGQIIASCEANTAQTWGCSIAGAGGFLLSLEEGTTGWAAGNYHNDPVTGANNVMLKLTINSQVYQGTTANGSSVNMIPLYTNTPPGNWVFFAVTYDGLATNLDGTAAPNLNYYWGSPTSAAVLDPKCPITYVNICGQAIGAITNCQQLSIGGNNPVNFLGGRTITSANESFFNGLIDEFHLFSRALTLAEIQQVQVAAAVPPNLLVAQGSPGNVALSWAQGAQTNLPTFQLQSKTNVLSSTVWSDVAAATNVSGTVRSLTLPTTNAARFFRLRSK